MLAGHSLRSSNSSLKPHRATSSWSHRATATVNLNRRSSGKIRPNPLMKLTPQPIIKSASQPNQSNFPKHSSLGEFWLSFRLWICCCSDSGSSFYILTVAMNFNDCAVNHDILHIGIMVQCFKNMIKTVSQDPSAVAFVRCFPLPNYSGIPPKACLCG